MTVLMKEALKPNLIQTLEGNPCFMHAGPFANIAHGNNSIVADLVALKCGDYVVTESGFGADMGAEKMMDIKCRYSGVTPDCVVITATIRALKMHGGAFEAKPGKKLDEELVKKENMPALEEGTGNLVKQIENMKLFGVPVVVTLNRRITDTDAETALVKKLADAAGVVACVPIDVWAKGGEGGKEAAEAIVAACDQPKDFKFLYEDNDFHQGEDRDHRHQDLRRGRRGLLPAGRAEDQAVHRGRLRQAAPVHGQDPPLAVPRPQPQGRAQELPPARPGHPPLHRRGVPLSPLRRDAHHARPALAPGRDGRGHRRGRKDHGPLLRGRC